MRTERRLQTSSTQRISYLLHQTFRYDYPSPVEHLEHRLMVVPPSRHGDQRRRMHQVEVRGAEAQVTSQLDGFGNRKIEVRSRVVRETIEFELHAVVDRATNAWSFRTPESALARARFLAATPLTLADAALADLAEGVRRSARGPADLAERITASVHRALHYAHGATGVRTTAADALALGAGVCQDYAHVMLAVARYCGLAARYVSGHLAGEGGSHAWVEVLAPDPRRPGTALVLPFDPTHDRRTGSAYVTVAVGRDYADVAPTSGTFRAACSSQLTCRKRMYAACG